MLSGVTRLSLKIYMFLVMFVSGSFSVLQAQENLNPNFDISGVKEFWKILDMLEADQEPPPKQWKVLFDTPGHNALRQEFRDTEFINFFQAAYMPSKAYLKQKILDEAEASGSRFRKKFAKSEFEVLDWTRKNRNLVTAKMNSFENYPYTRLATEAALAYLPEEEADNLPEVAFIIFNDSRGYVPVVMSLNHLAREETELTPEMRQKLAKAGFNEHTSHVFYFGHEFFHNLRDRKKEFRFPERSDDNYTLIWLLDQIENEGIADLINVKPLYWGPDAPLAGSSKAVQELDDRKNAVQEVHEFFSLLKGMSEYPEWKYGLSQQARRVITRSGHVAGFYMANMILDHFGREELISVVRNPFRFFLLYQKAAQQDRHAPRMTGKAIELIRSLEAEYVITVN